MIHFLLLVFCSINFAVSAPLSRKMVDLSHVFDNTTLYFPIMQKFELNVLHNGTFKDNENIWVLYEDYISGIHVGTHMDAPNHFIPGRWSIDEVPLDRFIVPAAVVDITEQAQQDRDYEVTVDDLLHWEQQTGHLLNEVVIMIRSGWSEKWHDREEFTGTPGTDESAIQNLHFPGLCPEAAQWLLDNRNIYGVGTETLSIDHGPSTELLTHRRLLDKNIYALENVASMKELPIYGATLYIMPLKIGHGSGSPMRIVASFPEMVY